MSSSMEVMLGYDYSTGDFLAFVTLVHKLYWLFFKVAKDAPEDFKKLVRDIGALFECISTLDEEATKPGSPLGRAKQERVRAVKNLISRGEVTLERLQTWAEKHETLREISRPKMKQWYDKARWAYNVPELDAMRKQVLGHVGFMRLFLNSLGKQYRENSSFDEVFAKSVMGAAFKNNEKVLQRHWAAIAADKWNNAGKLWLKSNKSASKPLPMSTPRQLEMNGGKHLPSPPPPPVVLHPTRLNPPPPPPPLISVPPSRQGMVRCSCKDPNCTLWMKVSK
ncbi:hypothetical protein DFP73DRAFT_563365 [Morchella snyderi]|nr:hypothetical protein DFP73DRAFT_563365 [Morchella snyderi]